MSDNNVSIFFTSWVWLCVFACYGLFDNDSKKYQQEKISQGDFICNDHAGLESFDHTGEYECNDGVVIQTPLLPKKESTR